MRVFLSHSSANKNFVKQVFELLGQASAEYDEATFSNGIFNSEAIMEGMQRSHIFALFATREALASGFVDFEIRLAIESQASRKIQSIICFCLDGVAPSELPRSLGLISAVRNHQKPGSCARFLKQEIIKGEIDLSTPLRPYVGRDRLAHDVKGWLASPETAVPVAVAFCGVDGVGRRTFSSRVLPDVYPGSGRVMPSINVEANSDLRDLYRSIISINEPAYEGDVIEKIKEFDDTSEETQVKDVCGMISAFADENEILQLVDNGGLLTHDGALAPHIKTVIGGLASRRKVKPYLALILYRMPPVPRREHESVVYYVRVNALQIEDVRQLLSLHVKSQGQIASVSEIEQLSELTDGHPYNVQFLIRLLTTKSISSICADASDLIAFKKRQGDEFVQRIKLESNHVEIIKILRMLGQASFDLIEASTAIDPTEIGRAIAELEDYHCIERQGNVVLLNRALSIAFERSSKFKLDTAEFKKTLQSVIKIYNGYKDENLVSVEIVSAASRAALFLNEDDEVLRAFILPSNAIFVGKHLYNFRNYAGCARVCDSALRNQTFVSHDAKVEAVRLRCLSLARLGDEAKFNSTLSLLDNANDSHAKSTVHFLKGFNFRLLGEPIKAITDLRISVHFNPKSFSTLRELSYCLMITGEIDEAAKYAEQALDHAPTNPYVLDLVLALRINKLRRLTKDSFYDPSISDLLDKLERYGDEEGASFYAIRMADIYTRIGDTSKAIEFAQRACFLTPNLFAAHLVEAQALYRAGGKQQALQRKFDKLQSLIDDRQSGEGKSNRNEFILVRASFLWDEGHCSEAVRLVRANESRLGSSSADFKKKISFDTSRIAKLQRDEVSWLKASSSPSTRKRAKRS